MEMFFPRRKLCPACGKPMTLVPEAAAKPREKYHCTTCDGDPLKSPEARAWIEGPLRPPAK